MAKNKGNDKKVEQITDMEVEGSFWEHEFEIRRGGQIVARIYKEWLTWGDCYCLDIADPADELAVLAVVLTIDCVAEAQSNN